MCNDRPKIFRGRHFADELILLCIRWVRGTTPSISWSLPDGIWCPSMQTLLRQRPGRIAGLILWAGSCLAQTNVGAMQGAKLTTPIHAVQCVAGTYFYLQADLASSHEILMTRKRTAAAGHKLLDLETLTPGKHKSNFEIQPSWDRKYVAIGVSLGGEGYSIRIVDAATAAVLPESITHSFDGDVGWSDSSTAFFYRKFQQPPDGASPRAVFTNMRAYLHNLGDDPSLDKPVFGPDINAALQLPVVGAVNAFPLPGTSLLVGVQSSAPTELDSFWVNNTHEEGRWRKIIDHSDDVVFEFSSRSTTLYFISSRNVPSGQLMAFDAAHEDISSARLILPASDLQLTDRNRDGVLCARDALYVYGHRKGVSALIRVPYDDPTRKTEIALPFAGVIANVSGDSRTSGLVFSLAGDAHPLTVYEYHPSKKRVIDARLTR